LKFLENFNFLIFLLIFLYGKAGSNQGVRCDM
jgi:hypothetical protein